MSYSPENMCELPEGAVSDGTKKLMLKGMVDGCYIAGFRCLSCGRIFPGVAHDTKMRVGYNYCDRRCAIDDGNKDTQHVGKLYGARIVK